MPWTKKDYPVSMKNLPEDVRNKAIEIANALLEEKHMDEGIAIATAISRAKDWAVDHGKPSKAATGSSRTTDVKQHGEDRYVVPHGEEWAVKKEKDKKEEVFDSREKAVRTARKEAKKANASVTIQGRHGKLESRESFNPNRRAPKQS
ncbi:MAG: DUF2188 domain-containing protein [Bacteroidota bacterium]|nr:DUF2188 domain-containing protein [Bacteroidota bacterium]MDP4216676.1 DUF2188 domain-containing protein [Bacteroidota bacterium]MDP4244220.1 DUF2188 domain-containing protein [Bacteroidota bacterium]MDP4253408.1 DUF2188 domain-containing protein [Bacteroidota bacterium]MDP4258880.1 DUF2188 domain-containing protein [Bacteroidota bacterium]